MQATHRIFQTEWLHELQVRYPWFCGYAIAPFAFAAGCRYGAHSLTMLTRLPPLLVAERSSAALVGAASTGATVAFVAHFVRRALEVLFVNDYTGTWARDSRLELLYYATWGLVAGSGAGTLALTTHGVAPRAARLAGLALFAVGQVGNAWCHAHLRQLRAEKAALRSSVYVVPSRGPFAHVSCPHYGFEVLTWLGYALHAGLDAGSAFLVLASLCAMAPFAADRHARYVKLYKDGETAGGDPARRWKMLPGVW